MIESLVKEDATVRKIIVVLGMHRSGTSAVTRGLEALGVNLGDNFVPDNWDNELGFWEDADIVAFNEDLQKKLGYLWYGSTVVNEISWDDTILIEAQEQAKNLLEKKINQNSIYAFKDPRTAVLIEFWLKIFQELGLTPNFIIALRNPLEVADSLFKRNGLSIDKSLFLWIASMIQSITYTKNKSCLIVGYDEMLRTPLDQLRRISDAFKLQQVNNKSEAVDRYCNEFLSEDLKHSIHADSELYTNERVPSVVTDLYFLLKKVANDEISLNDSFFCEHWDSLISRYAEYVPLLKHVNYIENKNETLEQRYFDIQTQLDGCAVELRNAVDEIDQLKASLSWKITKPLRLIIKYISK